MRSNLCEPIVVVIVSVQVAVLLVNEHVPGAAVVLPDFAKTVVNCVELSKERFAT